MPFRMTGHNRERRLNVGLTKAFRAGPAPRFSTENHAIGGQPPNARLTLQVWHAPEAAIRSVMPRALWTGAISFGLVNVPVRMYSAVQEQDLRFHFVHEKDGSRIGYVKVCKAEEKPVPDDEIVKAYEFKKGEYVFMEDEDFEAAKVDGLRTIEIEDFVPYDDIDPIYFEKTYFLGPQDGSEKVYALLAKAMTESGLAGIARYVMRDRENLGCLRIRDGVITLERMYFADEIRPSDELKPGRVKVDAKELEMAEQLIERFSGSWKPDKYEDTYRERLLEIVKAKRKGKEIHAEPEAEHEEPKDLMDALRASLEAAQGRRSSGGKRRSPSRSGGGSSRRSSSRGKAKARSKR
jgi:DNA end-binding protein Ku